MARTILHSIYIYCTFFGANTVTFWRTLKESCKGLGSVTLKIKHSTRTPITLRHTQGHRDTLLSPDTHTILYAIYTILLLEPT
jgi:hypothetical protein